jgi:uncharacterized membrane protein YvbJ
VFCPNCGANVNDGAHFCESCGRAIGAASTASPGTTDTPVEHHFDQNDALAAAGMAAPLIGRGGGGDLAGYMMSKAALENLEESGQGDSPMADMARTGLAISKFKIIASIVAFVIFIVIALAMYSSFKNSENQQLNGGLAPAPAHVLLATGSWP